MADGYTRAMTRTEYLKIESKDRREYLAKKKIDQISADVHCALAKKRSSADSDMLLVELIDVWGGTHQLAVDLRNEFKDARPGSISRIRVLELINRLIITNTAQDLGRSKSPSEYTDQEIADRLSEFVGRIIEVREDQGNGRGVVGDVGGAAGGANLAGRTSGGSASGDGGEPEPEGGDEAEVEEAGSTEEGSEGSETGPSRDRGDDAEEDADDDFPDDPE